MIYQENLISQVRTRRYIVRPVKWTHCAGTDQCATHRPLPLALLFGSTATAQETPQQNAVDGSVLIRNVRVFDGERVIPKTSVLVTNGKVAGIGPRTTSSEEQLNEPRRTRRTQGTTGYE